MRKREDESKMTNYEKIKNMSVEELARSIADWLPCDVCDFCKFNQATFFCDVTQCRQFKESDIVEKWLKEKAGEYKE